MRPSLALAFLICCWLVSARLQAMEPGASLAGIADRRFPSCAAVIDVTKPPYLARGDGLTDDTDALQRALRDSMGHRQIVYLPRGTYLISRTISWSKKDSKGNEAWGFNWIQGQNAEGTVIRLKDRTFPDPKRPEAMMWCGGFGSADWFHNYIQDVTFDVGRGNPGAIGLQFYSNNMGAVRNVAIVSGDSRGAIGLDLASRDMNGPLLVQNLIVRGFGLGIRCGASVNSQTLERIGLSGQSKYGLINQGQSLSVRGLRSENAVSALRAESFTVLLDSELIGKGDVSGLPAIEVGRAPFYARDVRTRGYRRAIRSEEPGEITAASNLGEFIQGKGSAPFDAPRRSLGLPVKETPEVPWDDPAGWAIVDAFGADPSGQADSSPAIQKAIDSGATTVFFPGSYDLRAPVRVRGKVRRLLGTGGWLDYNGHSRPDLIVGDGSSPLVAIEHFAPVNGGIVVATSRTVVLRSIETRVGFKDHGDVFLEDIATHDLRIRPRQRTWARELNVENEGTHVTNDGGLLWVFGYKTERGGTLLHTRDGGRTELFGNFSYTTTAGKLAPMFVTEDASVFAFFNEVCYSGDPFRTLIRETRGGRTKAVDRDAGWIAPYVAGSR